MAKKRSEETRKIISETRTKFPYGKPVVQMTTTYEVIKEWDSVIKASKELGINYGNLSTAARGEANHAGGYRWEYKD